MIVALILLWSLESYSTSFDSRVFSNERKLHSLDWNQGLIVNTNSFFDPHQPLLTSETWRFKQECSIWRSKFTD